MSGNLNVTDGLYPELEEAGTGVKGIGFEALAAGEQSNGKMDDAAAAPSATSESIELLEERKKSMTENEKVLFFFLFFFFAWRCVHTAARAICMVSTASIVSS